MHFFALQSKSPKKIKSAKMTNPFRANLAQSRQMRSIPQLQSTIDNHTGKPPRQTKIVDVKANSGRNPSPGLSQDLTLVPVHVYGHSEIQPKPTANILGDMYEQEANRVADQVMRMPEPPQRACLCGGGYSRPRTEYTRPEYLRAWHTQADGTRETDIPPAVHDVLHSSGQPLDAAARLFLEPRFGHDFSQVRLHADTRSAQAARAVNARAFTVGRDVVLGTGEYKPGTSSGLRLLAHELTHVLQQDGALSQPGVKWDLAAAPPQLQRTPNGDQRSHSELIDSLDTMIEALKPDADSRIMTQDELSFANSAERVRVDILSSAIDRLDRVTTLLAANGRELRPMSAEIAQTLQLIRRYLRIRPSGFFAMNSALALEFDYMNKREGEHEGSLESDYYFMRYAMKALELMRANRRLMLPKYVFKQCTPGLYAQTLVKMKLCPQFFGQGPDRNPVCPEWVLLHEYFHPLGVTHGESTVAGTMAVPGPKQAIKNANALASLTFELAGRDPSKCHAYGPRETHGIADCMYVYQTTKNKEAYQQCLKQVFQVQEPKRSPSK